MHNPMNRNPEENRPLDPFAAAEAPEMASETTYPVEADGEIHELTLDELIEAAAQGLSKHNAYVRRNRAAHSSRNIPMSVPRTFRSRSGNGRSRRARSSPPTASGKSRSCATSWRRSR